MKSNKVKCLWPKRRMKGVNNQNIWGFDIETDPLNKSAFLLATITNDDETFYFTNEEELYDFCCSYRKFRSSVFIATNLAFDFLGSFFRKSARTSIIERDGIFYGAKLRMYSDHTIEFRDTLRYHRVNVAAIGKAIGKNKLDDPRSVLDAKGKPVYKNGDKLYSYGKPRTKKEWDELKEYCQTDAYISYWFYKHVVTKWCDEIGVEVKLTMSSIAMEDFRTNYLDYAIKTNPHHINMLVFQSYYGGHTEAYERGLIKNVDVFDVNSLYPSVMAKNWFPLPSEFRHEKTCDMSDIYKHEGCAYIEGIMTVQKYPCLPVKKDGKLLFPCGKIKGWYVFPEIRHAIECGFELETIGECVIYEKRCKPFEKFVLDHYARRMERKRAKEDTEVMEKLAMNGLYGKFAFQYYHTDSIITDAEYTPDLHIKYDSVTKTKQKGYWRVVCENNDDAPATVIPIWSAYVTAYGRIVNNTICRKNGNVIYTDTDSFFVRHKHADFVSGDELGIVKKENEQPIKHMLIVRPKLYGVLYADNSSKIRAKGLKTLKTYEQFISALKLGKVTESRFMKFRQFLNLKASDKFGGVTLNELFKVEKSINLEDEKRVWPARFVMSTSQASQPRILSDNDYKTEDL